MPVTTSAPLLRRLTILVLLCFLPAVAAAHDVTFGTTVDSPLGRYAQRRLLDSAPPRTSARPPLRIDLAIDPAIGPEAFSIAAEPGHLTITGGDQRGLVYGALDAREQLRSGVRAADVRSSSLYTWASPSNEVPMVGPALALLALLVLLLTATVSFWPGWGLAARWRRGVTASGRVRVEDALKHLWDREYRQRSAGLESLAGALGLNGRDAAALVDRLNHLSLVRHGSSGLELTVEGRRAALRVVRIHRLWERYLADQTGLEAPEWHARAERHEHRTSDAEAEALAASLGHPRFDPHGDPIPLATGEVPPPSGRALTELGAGDAATIVHVEDEPEVVFAQIAAAGLVPGMQVRVLEALPHRIRLAADIDEVVLAPVVAANITVDPIQDVADVLPTTPLSALAAGEVARVVALSPSCRGAQRRRLLDLGIVPGTRIVHELAAPGGDPMAFRIRGALIALRRDHAALIQVDRATEVSV